MSIPRRWLLIVPVVLLLAAVIAALLLLPEVENFSPGMVEGGHANTTAFEITFTRRMNREDVAAALQITPEIEGKLLWEENTLTFIPMERWPAGTEVQVSLPAGVRSVIGLPVLRAASWRFQIAPVQLAYLWPSSGNSQLYLLDPDSGDTIQLTSGNPVLSYGFSPDGQTAYYFAENSLGGSDLYTLLRFEPDDEPDRLLSCQRAICNGLQVSPDGEWLAYTRNDAEIWMLSLLQPTDDRQVSPDNQICYQPLWSSRGLLSFYNADRLTYTVVDPAGGAEASWPNESGETAVWSPGGTALVAPDAFLVETDILRGPTGEQALQEVDEEELEPVRVLGSRLQVYQFGSPEVIDLTEDPLAEDFSPTFSPDGTILAFTRRYLDDERWSPGRQVWLMSLPGGVASPVQVRPLTDAQDYLYTRLTWHPDGQSLAAVRFNVTVLTDPPEIWLLPLSGQAVRLVIGGFQPQWVP